jgi:hypothetical protein
MFYCLYVTAFHWIIAEEKEEEEEEEKEGGPR